MKIKKINEMNNEEYDYSTVVKNDCIKYLSYEYTHNKFTLDMSDDEIYNLYYDDMLDSDDITGIGSSSYTINEYKAEENLTHNLELLYDACMELDYDITILQNPELCDCVIRYYLLSTCLYSAIKEFKEKNS